MKILYILTKTEINVNSYRTKEVGKNQITKESIEK